MFIADHPFNLLVNGKFIQIVPAMIGVTKNDGGFFVLQKGKCQNKPWQCQYKQFSSIFNASFTMHYICRLEYSFDNQPKVI